MGSPCNNARLPITVSTLVGNVVNYILVDYHVVLLAKLDVVLLFEVVLIVVEVVTAGLVTTL